MRKEFLQAEAVRASLNLLPAVITAAVLASSGNFYGNNLRKLDVFGYDTFFRIMHTAAHG